MKDKQADNVRLSQDLLPFTHSDSEFVVMFDNFVNCDVQSVNTLDDKTKHLAILSVLIGSQSVDEYKHILLHALDGALTSIQIKEILYQSVAYMGLGRVYPFFNTTNEVLKTRGIALPLEKRATTTADTRLSAGERTQIEIFGEQMKGFADSGEKDVRHINKWLTQNCFGDYYTRSGLDYRQRELVTFCLLYAQGGCEPQLLSHIKANLRIGNDKSLLIQIVSQCLPYIGYPRSLNAINCIVNATK